MAERASTNSYSVNDRWKARLSHVKADDNNIINLPRICDRGFAVSPGLRDRDRPDCRRRAGLDRPYGSGARRRLRLIRVRAFAIAEDQIDLMQQVARIFEGVLWVIAVEAIADRAKAPI